MDTKLKRTYQKIEIGQIWKRQVYSSGLSDNEYRGDIYYRVVEKQSMGQWKLRVIFKDPKDLRIGYDRWSNFWVKGQEIRQELEIVDPEQVKVQIVLYG